MKQLLGAKRIALFLRSADVEYLAEPDTCKDVALEDESLKIEGDVTWTSSSSDASEESSDEVFALRDLSLTFKRGQTTLIAGKYGSGKTLLLLALLGEVKLLRGKISYALSPIFDPWQTEQQVDWSETLQGLAYAPQVGTGLENKAGIGLTQPGSMASKPQYSVSPHTSAAANNAHLVQGEYLVWSSSEHREVQEGSSRK